MSQQRIEMIRSRLQEAFAPISLQIHDDSHQHAGHASAGGAGHFRVEIVAESFRDKKTIECHRMVFAAVKDIMHTEIHALGIDASAP